MKDKVSIFWFRRDLRLEDNHGLYKALISGNKVLPIFIFDTNILKQFSDKKDIRVDFIIQALQKINKELREKVGSSIEFFYGNPLDIFTELISKYNIVSLYLNEDYEPYAIKRDNDIKEFLEEKNVEVYSFKDNVIFHKDDILKKDGKPYTIYTPYSKVWLSKFNEIDIETYPSEEHLNNILVHSPDNFDITRLGFLKTDFLYSPPIINEDIIENYEETRDKPYLENGITRLGVHLRFGTLSIRKLVQVSQNLSEVYLKELIWREFFMQILYHFPYVEHSSFKTKYNRIRWENDETLFQKWCEGRTGYPIVDAGMRELNTTGFMHNRVRMIAGSFLTKDLLIDWRWGELYFANKLLDYDLSANNGNWQWVAGCGCDSSPYFRIFNPITQQQKFDPQLIYVKKWVKEFGTKDYPQPIIEHSFARNRTLERFKKDLEDEF